MSKSLNLQQRAKRFHNRFGLGKMILFIGQTATDEELAQIAEKKWACIFTSRTDLDIPFCFKNPSRRVQFLDELPGNPLELLRNGDELPIIRILKESQTRPGKYVPNPKALKAMSELLRDGLNYLIAVGYDYLPGVYDSDIDLPERFLEEYSPNSSAIEFWGVQNEEMRRLLEGYDLEVCSEALSSTMAHFTGEVQESATIPETEYFFFADGRPIVAPVGTALNNQNMMGIVTQRQIELIRPNGKYDCQQWFRNFLERSSGVAPEDGPQWYAYSKRLDFYVKRDCEDALVALVNQLLNNRWPGKKEGASSGDSLDKDTICNVVLEGDPGSGKSVTLAGLAYRIFQERKHPVIYIRDQLRREELNGLLESIKKSCGSNCPRILVIWDRSAYRPYMQSELENDLQKLVGRYHRFVMVSSAYVTSNYDIKQRYDYSEKNGFLRSEEGLIRQSRPRKNNDGLITYYLRIDRNLSEAECASLWNKFRTCSAIEPPRLADWKEQLADETDMFQICYKMLNVLRDNYRSSLYREHDVVSGYVQKELRKVLNKIDQGKSDTALASALSKAGLTLADFGIEQETQDTNADVEKLLEQVETRIAMFSRFDKMEVPYSYVKGLILAGFSHSETDDCDDNLHTRICINPDVVYSDDAGQKDLFRLMTTQIPWLRCGENSYGDFVCGFRNSLEAEIYLQNHNVSAEMQVNILIEMLEYYLACLEKGYGISPLFVTNLGKLLRNMGPNSHHPSFTSGYASAEHHEIQAHIYKVLGALGEICKYGKKVDKHYVCDYITFIREKYTPVDSGEDRLDWLEKAADMAWDHISDAQDEAASRRILSNSEDRRRKGMRSGADGILDTLKTEWAQCRRLMCQHWVEASSEAADNTKEIWTPARFATEFRTISQVLSSVIDESPMQGMYYNILFQTFIDLSSKFTQESRKDFLVQLLPYIDACEANDPNNDEQSRKNLHSRIKQISETRECGQYSISNLRAIEKGVECGLSGALCEDYLKSLENNDPVILVLASRRELAKVDFWQNSMEKKVSYLVGEAAKTVHTLLSSHYKIVSTDPYALWMLLSSMWTDYTGQGIFSREEPRVTSLTIRQWENLYRCSKDYCALAGNKAKPDACLLQVISGYYVEAFSTCKKIMEDWRGPLENNNHNRRRHPYRLCIRNQDGLSNKRATFNAIVCEGKNDGQVVVQIEGRKWNISLNSLGRKSVLPGEAIHVEIGVGYSGFSAYMIQDRST